LNTFIQLLSQLFFPSIKAHSRFYLAHHRLRIVVTTSLKALSHGGLERVCNLGISVTVENSPGLESRLREHLSLDLAINVSHVLLDVEGVRTSTSCWTHKAVTGSILESREFRWVLIELQVPELLLLDTFCICLEVVHKVFDLLNFGLSIGVKDNSKVLHQSEVSAHSISQAGELTQFRNKSDFVTSPSVLVDKERLVGILDLFIVAGLVVLFVACLGSLLIEFGTRALSKVHAIDTVSLLIVSCYNGATSKSLLDSFLRILTLLRGLVSKVFEKSEASVSADHFETHIDVQEDSTLFHD
jgi:hypothetical protein